MPPKELIEYIQYELQRNTPQEKIVADLLFARWSQEQIDAAFSALGLQNTTPKKKLGWAETPTGTLRWPILTIMFLVPFFIPIYFVGLIIASIKKKSFAFFFDGLLQMILAIFILGLVGFGMCIYMFSSL